ncbi:hypothetical protein H5410_042273 [Solanum commersonii]|uniref:Uncharacterized protein n=1 Tax=Solanum commersonii TaxID=4109 RepID=A0A9J5XVX9_SOLCO|nr:hypothetical protein H5410_042273 [Solanum commersonii]
MEKFSRFLLTNFLGLIGILSLMTSRSALTLYHDKNF